MDLTGPQSELSYSYSEMMNDYDGSQHGTNKMKMSGASYLKVSGFNSGNATGAHHNATVYT